MDNPGVLFPEPIQDVLVLRFHVPPHLPDQLQSRVGEHQVNPAVVLRRKLPMDQPVRDHAIHELGHSIAYPDDASRRRSSTDSP